MRSRLRILRPRVEHGPLGGEKTMWEETATVWAERVKVSPRHGMELGEPFPGYTVDYNIRWGREVGENWRVEEVGGHLYTVTNVIPNRERGMQTLKCERVNE